MAGKEELSLFDAITAAQNAKTAWKRLEDLWLKAKEVFRRSEIEELDETIPFWRSLYNEVSIIRTNSTDKECWYYLDDMKNFEIDRTQFEKKMKPQTDQIKVELQRRKDTYESAMKNLSEAYDIFVENVPDVYFKFALTQSKNKRFLIEFLLK